MQVQTAKAIAMGGGVLLLALAGGASASTGPRAKTAKDPALVDALAARLAADLRARKYDHSRQLVRDFQSAVGLKPDGIYGPLTASALKSRVPGAPSAMFLPRKPKTPSGRSLLDVSADVTRDLLEHGREYSRSLLQEFQRGAGLADDGIYGPLTAAKLRTMQPEAPDPLYLPKAGSAAAARLAAEAPRKVTTREIARKAADTSAPMDLSQLTRAQQAEIERENLAITHRRALRAAKLAAQQVRRGMDAGDDAIDASAPSEMDAATEDAALEDASEARDAEPEAAMGEPVHLELARREAPQVARHIARKGRLYSRQLVRDFQRHAGVATDGVYGPRTRDALAFFGVVNPPEALYPAAAAQYEPSEGE